ncbi:MAG: ISAs1 family transposase [Pseudonocardia sp.]|nr:ISAs1 family transposase [Pseudonocardia sp.]
MSVSHAPQPRSPGTAEAEPGDDQGEAALTELATLLAGVADPRKVRGIRHPVGAVLTIMVLAKLAGARNYRECADRAGEMPERLLELAGCRRRRGRYVPPSAGTMRRLASTIDADATDALVTAWLRRRLMSTPEAPTDAAPNGTDSAAGGVGDHPLAELVGLAIDGKTVRNSDQPNQPGSEIRLFSALLTAEKTVIAQVQVPEDTNEITQVPALLDPVDLTNVVVTADAAHAQHTTATYLTEQRGGHYVLTVKGNQPTLLTAITTKFPSTPAGSEHYETAMI